MREIVRKCKPRICEKGFAIAKKPDLGSVRICDTFDAFAILAEFAFSTFWSHLCPQQFKAKFRICEPGVANATSEACA